MANTEKPTTKAELKKQQTVGASKKGNKEKISKKAIKESVKKEVIKDIQEKEKVPQNVAEKEEKIAEEILEKTDKEVQKDSEDKKTEKESENKEEKVSSKKQVQKTKLKKEEAVVNGFSLQISTKDAIAICRFIKNKNIERAILELEDVLKMRRAIPIKGEIPHKKSVKGIASGSGRFPVKASGIFIRLLRSLKANSENNGLENPVIVIASANIASRPAGKFGRVRKKRSHVKIIAKERNKLNPNKK